MWGEHEFEDGVRFASTWVWFCLVVFDLFGEWWGLMATRWFNRPSRVVVGVFVLQVDVDSLYVALKDSDLAKGAPRADSK